MTLSEFLLARIAEDEAVARDHADLGADIHAGGVPTWKLGVAIDRDYCVPTDVTIDPARVLAECEAKRRIVAEHGPAWIEGNPDDKYGSPDDARYCRGCNANFVEEYAELIDECPTKRLLALPYADHPDYREEWRV